MKKLLFLLVAFCFSASMYAQQNSNAKQIKKENKRYRIDSLIKQEEEGVIVYKKQTVFGVKLNSDGYGFMFEKGYAKSIKKSLLFQLEIDEKKHTKEEKTSSGSIFSGNPYIYGKLNFFYPIKLGVQQQMVFGNKSNKNGVSVTGNFGGGLIIGLLRPYEVAVTKNGSLTYVSYNSPDSLLFINSYNDINTTGPTLTTGWNHVTVAPGLYVKPAVRFDYGRLNETVSAMEIGVTAEFYAQKIPQMLYNKQKQFFFSAYAAIEFGRRK